MDIKGEVSLPEHVDSRGTRSTSCAAAWTRACSWWRQSVGAGTSRSCRSR